MRDYYIDINCDVGEGVANENRLMPYISSCNIACGGHVGNNASMRRTVGSAKLHGVLIGAHPSYPDKENFGRFSMDIDAETLVDSIRNQISNLASILEDEQVKMHHIKPHGALYNDLVKSKKLAITFLDAINRYKESVVLYVPPNSLIAPEAIKQGFTIKYEAFADRNYNEDLSLVSRKLPNAIINDPLQVLNHLIGMVKNKQIRIEGDKIVKIDAETYCLHGDTPNALQILMYLSEYLPQHNIHIKK